MYKINYSRKVFALLNDHPLYIAKMANNTLKVVSIQ